jgi:hypothetical protein
MPTLRSELFPRRALHYAALVALAILSMEAGHGCAQLANQPATKTRLTGAELSGQLQGGWRSGAVTAEAENRLSRTAILRCPERSAIGGTE